MPWNLQEYQFWHISNNQKSIKIGSDKSTILITHVFRNIAVHVGAKYRKDRLKTVGACLIWNNVDGRTDDDDGRTGGRRMCLHRIKSAMSASELKINKNV